MVNDSFFYKTRPSVRESGAAEAIGGRQSKSLPHVRHAGVADVADNLPCKSDSSDGCNLSGICGSRGIRVRSPAVTAVQVVARMRGGSQSQLMLGDDGNLWVVKFRNNPQHIRVLANEWIATCIAAAIGLSVPECSVVHVGRWLIESNPQLSVVRGSRGDEVCSSGRQFGSRFAGGMMPRQVIEWLPDDRLACVRNLEQFPGILAFDKWTGNTDRRQVVFRRTAREKNYAAVFIDQGSCFGAGEWTFQDAPEGGGFARKMVYSMVTGWDSFEPWLTRIEQFSKGALWEIAETVPQEWYEGDRGQLKELIRSLIGRRACIRRLITEFRQTADSPFPNWTGPAERKPSVSSVRATYRPKVICG